MKRTTLCYPEKDGSYLMMYRNKKANDQSQGKWLGIGGKFEAGEGPYDCVIREVLEETGLSLPKPSFRGIIKFVSDVWETEYMYLFSADAFSGELKSCDEGELHWVEKEKVYELPIWEGDKEIFKALEDCHYFFTMEVSYQGERLVNKPVCRPSVLEELFEFQDKKYAAFQAKLVPGLDADLIIGVRIPVLRKLAREYRKKGKYETLLTHLPHMFYDEYLLHAILISQEKDYGRALDQVEVLLPYIDNWAVCDTLSPEAFKKNRPDLLKRIKEWSASDQVYTCRFGLKMLMTHFLDEDFEPQYLEIPASVRSEDYYVRMMVAWFFATALAKQWEAALPYIEDKRMDEWTHNKSIQKARESLRLGPEQKEYLASLKIKKGD